jgi:hypothetical protein
MSAAANAHLLVVRNLCSVRCNTCSCFLHNVSLGKALRATPPIWGRAVSSACVADAFAGLLLFEVTCGILQEGLHCTT